MPGTETMTNRPVAPRSRRRRPSRKKVVIIASVLAFLLMVGGLCAAVNAMSTTVIPQGVAVCGIEISGLSVQDAAAALADPAQTFLAGKSVQVTYQDHVAEIDVGAQYSIDPLQTAQNAFNANTRPLLFGLRRAAKEVQTVPLAVAPQNNGEELTSILLRFAMEAEEGSSFFTVAEDYTSLTVDLTNPGVLIDIDETRRLIQAQVEQSTFEPVTAATATEITGDDTDLLLRRIQHDPVDAAVEVVDNKPVVKPHQPGIQIDRDELERHLKNGDKTFTLSVTATMPEVTTDMVKVDFFADVLGEHSSTYNAALAGRTKNVSLAANAINGLVLAPGATFSFNTVVGERSYERGFMDATVYTNGGMEDGVGGGICQVSSTLYSAQLKADLETVSRRNHTFTVAYVPTGQDATVAYGSIDYVFKNNLPNPIKISAVMGGGVLTVKILGTNTEPGKKVTIVNETVAVNPFKTETKVDSSLQPGQTKVKSNGQNGATVDTYKVYWKDGVEQRREKIHRSVYSVLNKVVLVGPEEKQAPEATPESTPAPPPVTEAPTPDPAQTPPPEQETTPPPADVPTSDTGV